MNQFPYERDQIMAALNAFIGSRGGFLPLPPPDPNDRRVLSVPLLFVHGKGEDAESFGTTYARRDCYNPQVQSIKAPNIVIRDRIGLNGMGVLDTTWWPTMFVSGVTVVCHDTTTMSKDFDSVDYAIPGRDGLTMTNATWFSTRPFMKVQDYPLTRRLSLVWGLFDGNRTTPGIGRTVTNIDSLLDSALTLPDTITPFSVQYAGAWWKIIRRDVSYQEMTKGRLFRENLGTRVFKRSLVQDYSYGAAPDIIARMEHLDRRYDWRKADSGINQNGMFFFTAWDRFSNAKGSPPGPWSPADYPDYLFHSKSGDATFKSYPGGGQAFQLYEQMVKILDWKYGAGIWQADTNAKMDLVVHSQGGLMLRDLLAHSRDTLLPTGDSMPQGWAHPAAHLRKVVTLNSPHLGSSMAADSSVTGPEADIIKRLKEWTATTAELKPETKLETKKLNQVAEYLAGGGTLLAVTGHPVLFAAAIASSVGILLTDVTWKAEGRALGPYTIEAHIDSPLPWVTGGLKFRVPDKFLEKPRDVITEMDRYEQHLGPQSPWIADLKGAGYPILPGANRPANILPLYTPGMPLLRGDIASELQRMMRTYCEEHEDAFPVTKCVPVSWMLQGVAADSLASEGRMYEFFRDFHHHWTTRSDLVVDTASQTMISQVDGFSPFNVSLTGRFEIPRNYEIQKNLAMGHATEVAHGQFSFNAEVPLDESNLEFDLARVGAPKMGRDIYEALYGKGSLADGVHRVAARAVPVSLPALMPMDASAVDPGAGTSELLAAGNFRVQNLSFDSLVHGLSVRDSTGTLRVAAFYDRRQGSFLWTAGDATRPSAFVPLFHANVPVQLKLVKQGIVWTATAYTQKGDSLQARVKSRLPFEVRLGVLSSQEGRNADATPPLLLGMLDTLFDPSLDLNLPWKLRTFVVDVGGQPNVSRPYLVLENVDSRTLQGVRMEYWFTADPARKPVVEAERLPAGVTFVVENLHDDQYRIVVSAPQFHLAPGQFFPDREGVGFKIRNQDWSPRWNTGDWSRDANFGIPAPTRRIVVRQGNRILSGSTPQGLPPGAQSAVRVTGRDDGVSQANGSQPVFQITNTSRVPLQNFQALWYVKLGQNQFLQADIHYAPEAKIATRALGGGLWEVRAKFDQFILYPGQSTVEVRLGIHPVDWSTWNKSQNPSQATATLDTLPTVVVLDGQGRKIWGQLPVFTGGKPITPPAPRGDLAKLQVWVRDEQPTDKVYARPRVKVANGGTDTVVGFQLGLWVNAPQGAQVLLDQAWYAPGCQVRVDPVASGFKATYSCPQVKVAPGKVWPDDAGAVIGLHLPQWQPWDSSTSWSLQGVGNAFVPTNRITVEGLDGTIVKGVAP
ncbi:MAG: hypothetical protein IPK50_09170 [Fibrobacterota bacterium]|nr:MAG: hypothetical protein IPK50_09170 [Fibrobacterota bacterium]